MGMLEAHWLHLTSMRVDIRVDLQIFVGVRNCPKSGRASIFLYRKIQSQNL